MPPPVVQVRVSTVVAGVVTVGEDCALLRAAAGIFAAGTPPAQFTGSPSEPSVHVAGGVAFWPFWPFWPFGVDVGAEELLGPGGAAFAGAATIQAAKHSTTVQIVPMSARRCDWGDIWAPRKTGRRGRRGSRDSRRSKGGDNVVGNLRRPESGCQRPDPDRLLAE